jgi:uncharacterized membrane protein
MSEEDRTIDQDGAALISDPVAPSVTSAPSVPVTPPAADAPASVQDETPAPVETVKSEPAVEEPTETETAPETQAPAVVPQIETPPSMPPAVTAPAVKEVVIENEKPFTDQDKDRIFREKLDDHLVDANRQKHARYEAHLQEIVDFIRQQGTLVTNQDIEEGLMIPDSTVTKRLNDLIKRGIVQRLGDRRHAKYKLKEGI